MKIKGLKSLETYEHDLPVGVADQLSEEKYLAVDTETGGLDYRKVPLLLVQISTPLGQVFMVKKPDKNSHNLIKLIQNGETSLIFHNATFDICFLKAGLMAEVGAEVHCTKTLMKIAFPQYNNGLGSALKTILDISINKKIDHTKWDQDDLSERQLQYAAGDVIYLYRLLKALKLVCSPRQYSNYSKAMNAIKLISSIKVEGYTDLFMFESECHETSHSNRLWWNRKLSSKFEEDENVTV